LSNLNKQNKFINLEAWCEKYYKEAGLKVHPSNVPTDVILDQILGALKHYWETINPLIEVSLLLEDRIKKLESSMIETNKDLLGFVEHINSLLEDANQKEETPHE